MAHVLELESRVDADVMAVARCRHVRREEMVNVREVATFRALFPFLHHTQAFIVLRLMIWRPRTTN